MRPVSLFTSMRNDELAARLRASKNIRPVVAGKSGEELTAFIASHLKDREKFYNQAQIVYKTDRLITKDEIHLTVGDCSRNKKLLK